MNHSRPARSPPAHFFPVEKIGLDALAVGIEHSKVGIEHSKVGIEHSKVNWVLDADIAGFFDAVNHEWLIRFVERRIGDRRVIRLLGQKNKDRWDLALAATARVHGFVLVTRNVDDFAGRQVRGAQPLHGSTVGEICLTARSPGQAGAGPYHGTHRRAGPRFLQVRRL